MNFPNNFNNQSNAVPDPQQQYWIQQSIEYQQQQQQQWQFNVAQQFVAPTYPYSPLVSNFNVHTVPPPPPAEPRIPAPDQRTSGPNQNQNQRGNLNNSGNRGKNKPQQQTRGKGNQQRGGGNQQRGGGSQQRGGGNQQRGGGNQQRGGGNSRGGNQFSSDRGGGSKAASNSTNNQFQEGRQTQQNQAGFSQNKPRNTIWNQNNQQNQNWNQQNQNRAKNDAPTQRTAQPSQNTGSSYSNVQRGQSSSNEQSSPKTSKSDTMQEEIEFDEQFRKWEEEFDKWKKANVNHPDKNAYRQYEQQFESVRVKLLQRRCEMQKRKLELNPPKTDEQLKFESQWKAGGSQNEGQSKSVEVSDHQSMQTNKPPALPQDRNDSFHFNSFEDMQNFSDLSDFSNLNSGGGIIPGLDLPLEPEPAQIEQNDDENLIDLDLEENLVDPKETPPPLPQFFSSKSRRPMIDISEILDQPGRSKRYERILVLIRGPPGSGKSYLSNLIQEKEVKMGNNKCTVLNLHKFNDGTQLTQAKLSKFQDDLFKEFVNIIKNGFYTFIVVELEGGKLTSFHKLAHNAMALGKFKIYYIEIHQPYDVCMKYNINRRSFSEVIDIVEDIERFQPSLAHSLLDPTSLLTTPVIQNILIQPTPVEKSNFGDLASNLAQLLQNKNVMDLLQSQLNTSSQETKSNALLQTPGGSNTPMETTQTMIPENVQQNQFKQNQQNQFQGSQQQNQFQAPQQQNQFQASQQQNQFRAPQQQNQFQTPQQQNQFQAPQQQNQFQASSQQNQFRSPQQQQQNQFQPPPQQQQQNQFQAPQQQQQQNQFQPPRFPQQQNNFQNSQQNFNNNRDFNPNFNSFNNPNAVGKENFDSNFSQPQVQEPVYDNCPTFTPSKIIDYKHAHLPSLYEQLMEFKVFRVTDYKHRTTPALREFVREVDTDRIIAKRKSVALRKKILEYLRSAERPEDTVSNPKYPRNWEVIPRERPPLKNKRKKLKTRKILRVLARNDDTWMTKGYKGSDTKMELEEISSDESLASSFGDDCKILENEKIESIGEPTIRLAPPGTTPDFNRFDHKRVMDIKSLLWSPARRSRPPRISIILRGASGSGKSHLSQLIKKKETEMGNSGVRIVSINDYFAAVDEKDYENESQMISTFMNQMVKLVEKRMKESVCNFIIIDAENIDLKFYHQFYQTGASKGFRTYTIELYQTLDVCVSQNIHKKSVSEIKAAIENLERYRIPFDHVLLIATELYIDYKCQVNPALKKDETVEEKSSENKIPKFNWHQRTLLDIEDILEEPGRNMRDNRIMIILRGPSGSGKSYLAGLIRAKEVEKGNAGGVVNLSIDDYFIDPFTLSFKYNHLKATKNIEGMLQNLQSIIGNSAHNFIIIDAENGDLSIYERFYKVALDSGFKCYAIELFQDAKVCYHNNVHNRSFEDIEKVITDMKQGLLPAHHVLLNPTYLYTGEARTSVKRDDSRPLKSALKTTECLVPTPTVGLNRLSKPSKPNQSIHEEFRSRLKQPVMVHDEFIVKSLGSPKLPEFNWHNRDIVEIREILEEPGRSSRPERIMIVLRGAPGSGKTYLAYLIERKEIEKGNRAQFRLLSMDENFESVKTREVFDENGTSRTETYRKYDYEPAKLNFYMDSLLDQLKNITQNSDYKFIVVDGDFCDLKFYEKASEIAKANGYTGYTIELNQDDEICQNFNIHKRNDEVAEKNKVMGATPTPNDHTLLDPEYLYNEYDYKLQSDDEKMEMSDIESDDNIDSDDATEPSFGPLKRTHITSIWDDDDDVPESVIERLDGTRGKTFEKLTMAAYLKTDDEWTMRASKSGKKRVRWADIEEKKEQEKMRQIGFIVGQTDWKRMTDDTDGKSALEKTKYIESRKK